jgi:hypothetical protein
MKVGDYVRTKNKTFQPSQIAKIKDIEKDMVYKGQKCLNLDHNLLTNYEFLIYEEDVIKSSPNIIGLIEEHDILKIEEQKGGYTICEVEVFREPYEEYTFLGVRIDNRPIARKLYELNIKSIVTKECFESMEYKVKE